MTSARRELGGRTAAGPPTPLRRNRDFLLLWSGELVSTLGSQISFVAFPLLVLALTGSPAKAGLVASANTVPVLLFYLPAGVFVDRHDRRRIMVAANAVGAIALASIPVALAIGDLPFGQILAVAFLQGTVTVVYSVTEQSALPRVVHPSQVPDAIARNEARTYSALLAGPPLGGVLFGISRTLPFTADAVSYLGSAFSLLLLRSELQDAREPAPRRLHVEIGEGLRWLWQQRFLRASALAVAAGNFVSVALDIVLVVRAKQHGASSAEVGVMFSLLATGALLGALLAPTLRRHLSGPVIVIGTFWFEAAVLPLLALTTNPYLLGAIAALDALMAPAWNAVVVGARLTLTPDRLRGRVNSGARLISGSMLPLGSLAAGLLIEATNTTTTTLLVLAAFQLLVALASTGSASIRRGIPAFATPINDI